MSENTRAALADLLEQYGSSLAAFDQLRSDSYEQVLAGQSLERLEHLYSELFRPGRSSEEIVATVPPWPPGTRFAGEQPSRWLLDKIKERFHTESSLNTLAPISDFLDAARRKASVLPIGKQEETLDAIITFVGQELIAAKMRGESINLDGLDRLQNQRRLKQNDERLAIDSRRIALLESKIKSASDEVKKLRDKAQELSESERAAVLSKVDEILGIKA
jgi:hypothetical protein